MGPLRWPRSHSGKPVLAFRVMPTRRHLGASDTWRLEVEGSWRQTEDSAGLPALRSGAQRPRGPPPHLGSRRGLIVGSALSVC